MRCDVDGKPLAHKSNEIGEVYFVQVAGRGLIKIGFTRNLKDRLRHLRCGHPSTLKLLGAIPGTIHDEQEWHQMFAESRRSGEWFAPSPHVLEAINTALLEKGRIGSEIEVKSRTIPGRLTGAKK